MQKASQEYREHRCRVSIAKARVDSRPPTGYSQRTSRNSSTTNFDNFPRDSNEKIRNIINTKSLTSMSRMQRTDEMQCWENLKESQRLTLNNLKMGLVSAAEKKTLDSSLVQVAKEVAKAFKEQRRVEFHIGDTSVASQQSICENQSQTQNENQNQNQNQNLNQNQNQDQNLNQNQSQTLNQNQNRRESLAENFDTKLEQEQSETESRAPSQALEKQNMNRSYDRDSDNSNENYMDVNQKSDLNETNENIDEFDLQDEGENDQNALLCDSSHSIHGESSSTLEKKSRSTTGSHCTAILKPSNILNERRANLAPSQEGLQSKLQEKQLQTQNRLQKQQQHARKQVPVQNRAKGFRHQHQQHQNQCLTRMASYNPKKERDSVRVLKYCECKENLDHRIPPEIFRYYERLTFYKEEQTLQRLLRPKFTLNFASTCKNYVRDLGSMTFQIYTEACPGLVLELARCCNTVHGHNRFGILRIFDPVWIEGEFEVSGTVNLPERLCRHDPKVISHDIGSGVLSFMLHTVQTSVSHREILCFTISLSPLDVPRGQRIAIGVLVEGHQVLKEMKKFATKSGKPTDRILVTGCSFSKDIP